jgi:hypothetical protein
MENNSTRMDESVEQLLARVHDSSGSTITANSRRMRTLPKDSDEFEEARRDTKADILNFGHVSIETKAECVDRFAEMAAVPMHVCGACGVRDPFDPCKVLVDLHQLSSDHWLEVGQDAYTRLKELPDMQLLRTGTNGGYETVSIPRTDLHSLVEVGQQAYHVVPEALLGGQHLRLCKRCGRAWDSNKKAKRSITPDPHAVDDDLEDLYALNAPPWSIARGADFGRLSGMRSKGVRVDVSTLERLLGCVQGGRV